MTSPAIARVRRGLPVIGFAALCYVPLLLTAPGVVVADTKSYLYIDPGRLLRRAASMWDPHVGMGTVTHQNIGYLWPMGPYYWLLSNLGLPVWVAQRLWLGSILFLAGLGVRYLLRTFGWQGPAVWVAALAYALTPYTLTVAARISALLLPFSALPWLIALAIRAGRTRSWRHPALFALIVTTVGTSNATAIILAGVGPVLWFPYAVWWRRELPARDALAAMGKIGALTLGTNAWWIVGLSVQATNGIDVLRYTETATTVASASLANEVLRGLGYWFFYGGDRLGPWIEPSVAYTQRLGLLGSSYLIPSLALLGATFARWRHRAFFAAMLLAGAVLAVGAHPWDHPSPFGHGIKAFLATSAGLAMRSLPRAEPLVALALAVLLGAGVLALLRRRPAWRWLVVTPLLALIVVNYAPLWQRGLVPQNLRRPEDLPSYWIAAGQDLTRTDDGTRVLEIPGSDFASYRWGNTVDPITTGLTDRPVVARELVPSGSPQSANVLDSFDLLLQAHTAAPSSFAPMARIMRAGQVLVRSDLQFERYNTPRPKELWALVQQAPGLGTPKVFGPSTPNVPVATAPLDDELALSLDPKLQDPPAVAVIPVTDPVPIMAAKSTAAPVVYAGDGSGLVAAASAGLIDGREVLRASAAMTAAELRQALGDGAALVLTDTNRRRGERWGSVRNNRGYTEPAGLTAMAEDPTDNRLPLYPDAGDDAYTVALQNGIEANATSYGYPTEYLPEDRPDNAVDGDPATAWRVGEAGPAIGARLRLDLDSPVTTDHITLAAPTTRINRWITKVKLTFDGKRSVVAALGDAYRDGTGQVVSFPSRTFKRLEIEILDDTGGRRPGYGGLTATGFSEVGVGDRHTDEVIRLPVDLLDRAGTASTDHPLAIVLSRLRSAPTEVRRDDEELAIVRAIDLPAARQFSLAGTARLSPRVDDQTIDTLVGVPAAADGGVTATSSARLAGPAFRAGAAVDGDSSTAWSPPFGEQVGQWLDVATDRPLTVDHLHLTLVADGRHSVPTRLGIEVGGQQVATAIVPAVKDRSAENATVTVDAPLDHPVTASDLRVVVDAVRSVSTIEWYTGSPIDMPVGIAELGLPGLPVAPPPATFDTGCRSDLLTVDGGPVPVEVQGSTAAALAGDALSVTPCAGPVALGAGQTVLRTAEGKHTGIDLDGLVLRSAVGGGPSTAGGIVRDESPAADAAATTPKVEVVSNHDSRVVVDVSGAEPGTPFWLSFGQSFNPGWQATIDGHRLPDPVAIDGIANGWRINPTTGAFRVTLSFAPQHRVWIGIWISIVAVLACVVLAIVAGGRAFRRDADEVPAPLDGLVLAPDAGPPAWARSLAVGGLAGIAGVAFANPVLGVVVGVIAVAATRVRAVQGWLRFAPAAALAMAGMYVIVWQLRYDVPANGAWPATFERAHLVGWAAVLLLVADVLVRRVRPIVPERT